ncbi:MAG TPA: hypothetical protein VFV34_24545 [Blastocatellia bacterium]|nr:hypothetical protein [Blastocatellia bacterium]
MRNPPSLGAYLFLALLLISTLPFGLNPDGAAGMTAGQQPDVRLRVETVDGRTEFRIGELIPLKLSFTSTVTKKYQINMASYDRSGRMSYEEFLLEPAAGWSDPLEDYFSYGGFFGGGLTSYRFLSSEPTMINLDLNEWVRFDLPGKCRLRIASHRVADVSKERGFPASGTDIASNDLELTIVPATSSWQQQAFKKALAMLNRHKSNDRPLSSAGESNPTRIALKSLRYLGTGEAVKELARRFRGEDSSADFQCMFGLVGSPHRSLAISELQRLLADPDHPVSSLFIHTLIVLMRSPDQSQEQMAEAERTNSEVIHSQLLAAVQHKRGKALALTLNTVLETTPYEQGRPKTMSEELSARIAAVFDQLPLQEQGELLEWKWESIKSSAFLPILRKYAQQYRDIPVPNEASAADSLHLTGEALRRWYEIEPGEARPAIIREILRPKPRYSASVLGILPDRTLPEVEQSLADRFSAEPDHYVAANLASLLHRYATDSVLPQVLPVVDKNVGKWACAIQAPILSYLLRVSPAIAKPRIEAAMAARGEGYSACNRSLLMDLVEQDAMLDEIAVASLDDADAEVAASAATFLGNYGTASTRTGLRERLVRWNSEWRGRADELRSIPAETNPNQWQRNLGSNLIRTLAAAKSWVTDDGELRSLRQLAVDPDSVRELEIMIAQWDKKPWAISYNQSGTRPDFNVLQYDLNSIETLEEKLAQFPTGSSFTWVGSAPGSDEEARFLHRISEFLAKRGMKLDSQLK